MSVKPEIHAHEERFPWKHIIGFVLSLALTAIALWLVYRLALPPRALILTIVLLAVAQLLVQLLLFMHLTERVGPAYHTGALVFGIYVAITVVWGSLWIMSFKPGAVS